jgi:hypothetical protein
MASHLAGQRQEPGMPVNDYLAIPEGDRQAGGLGSLDFLFDDSLLQEGGMEFPMGECSIIHAPADDTFIRKLTETVCPAAEIPEDLKPFGWSHPREIRPLLNQKGTKQG